jgi:16S rRNA C967 or C1407 C5-methylase (RsmB/RsmF family)
MNERFENYFSNVYKERWPAIWQALQQPVKQEIRKNAFFVEGQTEFYKMDPASILVAQALKVQENDLVLDMCAAPGGKSLILAEGLNQTGQLMSNEISKDRRDRLTRVFQDYIPRDQRHNVFVKGLDGNQYGLQMPEHFDKVLCDVPCSGERHLIENATEFKAWTEKRSRNLAIRQFSLLSSGWLACKPGGRIVYSTCSISPLENDEIIKKLKKRRDIEVLRDVDLEKNSFIEQTECGYQILPDTCDFGPMYFAVVLKV